MEHDGGYRQTDWIDDRIVVRTSLIHGRGMFASTPIKRGDVITVWGGTLLLTADHIAGEWAAQLRADGYVWATIGEGVYLASVLDGQEDLANLINHSCDPNVWMRDEVTLIARRNIAPEEELTIDYAMFEGSEDYVAPWECQCGSECCRGRFTGMDWRRRDLQLRYGEHFAPFINKRIRQECNAIKHQGSGAELV